MGKSRLGLGCSNQIGNDINSRLKVGPVPAHTKALTPRLWEGTLHARRAACRQPLLHCRLRCRSNPRPDSGPLTIARQGSFFVGGREVKSDTLSTLPAYAASGTITVDQMYVRYQVPVGQFGVPIVLIHGCCLTGKTWETTPDGRMGWDEYFVRHAHPTYVIDQVWRGRSAADPSAINAVRSGKAAVDQLPTVFSAGHESAWAIFRFGKEYPQTMPGMRYPVAAQAEF
jgi:hypothetical protein